MALGNACLSCGMAVLLFMAGCNVFHTLMLLGNGNE